MKYLIVGRKTYDYLESEGINDAVLRLPGTVFELSTKYKQGDSFLGEPAHTMDTGQGAYVFIKDCIVATKTAARFYGKKL